MSGICISTASHAGRWVRSLGCESGSSSWKLGWLCLWRWGCWQQGFRGGRMLPFRMLFGEAWHCFFSWSQPLCDPPICPCPSPPTHLSRQPSRSSATSGLPTIHHVVSCAWGELAVHGLVRLGPGPGPLQCDLLLDLKRQLGWVPVAGCMRKSSPAG